MALLDVSVVSGLLCNTNITLESFETTLKEVLTKRLSASKMEKLTELAMKSMEVSIYSAFIAFM